MNENQKNFLYTYSAKDQAEIQKIREKYITPPKKELSKLEQLRRLDAGVTEKATIAALAAGILGTLILGTGMSLILTDLGHFMGTVPALFIGVILGTVGMIFITLSYPLYLHTIRKERARIAPKILQLTDELMQ